MLSILIISSNEIIHVFLRWNEIDWNESLGLSMMMLRAYHVQWTICIVCIVKVSLVTVIICAFHSAPHSGSLLGVDFCVSFSKAQTQSFNEMNWRRSIGSKLFNLKKKHRITVQDGKTNQSREKNLRLSWFDQNTINFSNYSLAKSQKSSFPKQINVNT